MHFEQVIDRIILVILGVNIVIEILAPYEQIKNITSGSDMCEILGPTMNRRSSMVILSESEKRLIKFI